MSEVSSSNIHENENELRLDLPAAHSASRMARQVVRRFVEVRGMDDREIQKLELITSELLGNAVDHGGGGSAMEESDLEREVRMLLSLELSETGWELRVSDQGGGNPTEIQSLIHPDGFPDLEDERGRGFFLMGEMVDDLNVEKSEDGLGLVFIAIRRFETAN